MENQALSTLTTHLKFIRQINDFLGKSDVFTINMENALISWNNFGDDVKCAAREFHW